MFVLELLLTCFLFDQRQNRSTPWPTALSKSGVGSTSVSAKEIFQFRTHHQCESLTHLCTNNHSANANTQLYTTRNTRGSHTRADAVIADTSPRGLYCTRPLGGNPLPLLLPPPPPALSPNVAVTAAVSKALLLDCDAAAGAVVEVAAAGAVANVRCGVPAEGDEFSPCGKNAAAAAGGK